MMLSISDLLIINKFIFNHLKININIKNNFETFLFFDKKKTLTTAFNALVVSPNYLTIYFLITLVNNSKVFTRNSKIVLEDYVSFTRAEFNPQVKSWCDWCSVVNGYASFLINSINEYFGCENTNNIETNHKLLIKLKSSKALLNYFNRLLLKEEDDLISIQTDVKPDELFPSIYNDSSDVLKKIFELITDLYNMLQSIERRWCPFQHMKRIAMLKHTDQNRYDNYLECDGFEDIIKSGDIIFKFNHITCHKCVEQINTHLDNKEHQIENNTYLNDFFDLICRLSRSK